MMIKRIFAGILLTVLVFSAACSGGGKFELDQSKAAQTILDQAGFQEALTDVSGSAITNYYPKMTQLSDAYTVQISSTGAVVDEFAIVKAKEGVKIEDVRAMLEARVEEQRFRYVDYQPQEIPKLDDVVIETKGDVAVMVVSGDSAQAAKTVKELLK